MLRVGLTGGIGSGKSTVAQIFEVIGIPVYYADRAAKILMNEDVRLISQIKKHFGEETYRNDLLNSSYLAAIVFEDPSKLSLLNSLVHPVTIADATDWMETQKSAYIIKEAALIFESKAHEHLDYVIGVHAPYELRLKRAIDRDNITEEAVLARMNKQMPEEKKLSLCQYILNNDETVLLIPQVISLHEKLLMQASQGQS